MLFPSIDFEQKDNFLQFYQRTNIYLRLYKDKYPDCCSFFNEYSVAVMGNEWLKRRAFCFLDQSWHLYGDYQGNKFRKNQMRADLKVNEERFKDRLVS